MRIVHVLNEVRIELGGVARAVLDMCAGLADAGHEVTLLTWDDADVPEAWRGRAVDGVAGAGLPRSMLLRRGPVRTLPAESLRRAGGVIGAADVLHLHNPWEPANLQLAAAARRAGVPYVLSIHGMLDEWSMLQSRLKKRVFRAVGGARLVRRAAAIHCTAEAERLQAERWITPAPGVVVPLIMDLSDYAVLPGAEVARRGVLAGMGSEPIVLFLSRIHPKKGGETLIRAVAQVRSGVRPCSLVFAGTGEDAYVGSLRALAAELGLEGAVRFVGLVRGAEKLSLYQAAAVLAIPTHQENFGLVFPESLACGTPVVTTRGVDIWPELESSGGAVIVDRTPGAFAEAIGGLVADADRARAMGLSGRAWVLRELAPERTVERLVGMYGAAVSGVRSGERSGAPAENGR